jgi:phospholipase C
LSAFAVAERTTRILNERLSAKLAIQHVIVVVGENHTFDNLCGAYIPRPGQTVFNLLSQDIIDDNGKPGRNFALALQKTADPNGAHSLNPMRTGKYSKLPQPNTTYAYRSAPQCTGRAWRWYEPDVR